jgi:hypothetical protein
MLGGVETAHPGGVNPDGPTVIATVGGGSINLFNPEAGSVDLEDIASSISKLVRFTGQTHSTITIAEHSVTVLSIFDALYPRAKLSERQYALLHDAHEAYLNDITAPAKRAIEQQVGLEMDAAWEALSPYIDPSIRTHAKADMNAAINRRVVKSVSSRGTRREPSFRGRIRPGVRSAGRSRCRRAHTVTGAQIIAAQGCCSWTPATASAWGSGRERRSTAASVPYSCILEPLR